MSNSMDDVAKEAKAFFIIGSNTTEQHPVFGAMLRQAVRQRGAKLVVADPRKIDITEFATLHLRHRPGTCLLYTSPSPRDGLLSRMPSSA